MLVLPFSATGNCPHCGEADITRAHRRWYDRPFGFALLPWRCRQCRFRFYMRTNPDAAKRD